MGEGRGTGWRDCSLEMGTRIDDTRGGPAAKLTTKAKHVQQPKLSCLPLTSSSLPSVSQRLTPTAAKVGGDNSSSSHAPSSQVTS
jgi:hypothetical protein